nr:hypothetical protein [Tessaracoccus coleopterorum]
MIAGIPAGAESARIVLTNPGTERLDVAVSALGATSSYEPAPAAGLSLEPRSSVVVDLGSSLGERRAPCGSPRPNRSGSAWRRPPQASAGCCCPPPRAGASGCRPTRWARCW